MKKKTIHYSIAEPCHESWANMTPHEKGRFCNSCAKPVVDFTKMPDWEINSFMSNTTSSVCGRMTTNQLNRDHIFTVEDSSSYFSLRAVVLGTALATFSALSSCAQEQKMGKMKSEPVRGEVKIEQVETHKMGDVAPIETKLTDFMFSGKVVNHYENSFVEGAIITIYDQSGKLIVTLKSTTNGSFEKKFSSTEVPFKVVFEKEKFESEELLFSELLSTQSITVDMHKSEIMIQGLMIREEK